MDADCCYHVRKRGSFCWYSYVNPLMTEVSGFSVGTMPVLMLLAGASMCVGNYLGGHLSDRFTPGIVAMSMQFLMFASLLLIYFFASYGFLSALLMCVCTLVACLQFLLHSNCCCFNILLAER